MPSTDEINDTPKCIYLPISKLHSILAIENSLAHNNITMIYYVQVNSLRLKSNVAWKWASKHLWGAIYFAVDGTWSTRVRVCAAELHSWQKRGNL